jgi:hypothetical protein
MNKTKQKGHTKISNIEHAAQATAHSTASHATGDLEQFNLYHYGVYVEFWYNFLIL